MAHLMVLKIPVLHGALIHNPVLLLCFWAMIPFRFVIVILTLLAFYTTSTAGYTLSNMLPHKKQSQKFTV